MGGHSVPYLDHSSRPVWPSPLVGVTEGLLCNRLPMVTAHFSSPTVYLGGRVWVHVSLSARGVVLTKEKNNIQMK